MLPGCDHVLFDVADDMPAGKEDEWPTELDGDEWPPPLELMVYSGLDNLVDAEACARGSVGVAGFADFSSSATVAGAERALS